MVYFRRKVSPIGLEARCLSHNLLQVIKKILIYPCFWGSVSEKKSIIYGAVSLFSGVGGWGWGSCRVVVLWGGVHFLVWCCVGAVFLPWRSPVLGAWASAGVGAGGPVVGLWWACGGGPVVGRFSPSLKISVRLKKTGRVGFRAVPIFATPPPISCRGWRGWVVAWAWVGCAILARLRGQKKPTSHDAGENKLPKISAYYSVGSVGSLSVGSVLAAASNLNLRMLPPINL